MRDQEVEHDRPPSGRRRPGTAVLAKGRRSADAVLDAATEILAEQGHGELSTRKVAARAGMRPGNLQYYFPAKRDMVRALLERYLERSLERLARRMARGDQRPEARLRKALQGILSDHDSVEDCTIFRELWALAAHDPDVEEAMSEFYGRYQGYVEASLRGVNPGLSRTRARHLATLVVAMLEGLSLLRGPGTMPSGPRAREVCRLVVHLAIDG